VVLRDGETVRELAGADISEDAILQAMAEGSAVGGGADSDA
jgi:ABC-type sugar transport system ATPase subunit